MLCPTRPAPRGPLQSWWRKHVTEPLDSVYDRIDERQEDQRDDQVR